MSAVAIALANPATLAAIVEGSIQAIQFLNSQISMYEQGNAVSEAQLTALANSVAANTKATTALLEKVMGASSASTMVPVAQAQIPSVQSASVHQFNNADQSVTPSAGVSDPGIAPGA